MQGLVKAGRRDPTIRTTAAELLLVSGVPAKDFYGEAETIFNYVQSTIRYTQDVNDVETLHPAQWVLANGYGDCDDFSILIASMLESVGHKCRFMAISFEGPEDFSHVLVQTKIGDRWITVDATEPEAFGWQPPDIRYWLAWYI
jgi:transglutaminase-like putative cysteine protease